jgi:hypothetical protein
LPHRLRLSGGTADSPERSGEKQGEAIGQESGVRICVCIVDQETFVFSPTPRQLEAPPGDSPPDPQMTLAQPKANGIVLSRPPERLVHPPQGRRTHLAGLPALAEADRVHVRVRSKQRDHGRLRSKDEADRAPCVWVQEF